MRLIYITSSFPFGAGEAFFTAEVYELLRLGHELLIVPRSPKRKVTNRNVEELCKFTLRRSLMAPRVLAGAACEFLAHPIASLKALGAICRGPGFGACLKNLLVFPKGLWLGRVARRWKADHIHAQWAATTATTAMLASRVSGIPWSFTAHRGDIVSRNLLAAKCREASFVRFISRQGAVDGDRLRRR